MPPVSTSALQRAQVLQHARCETRPAPAPCAEEGMGRHGIADSVDAAQLETEPWLVLGPHGSPPDAAMEARAAEDRAFPPLVRSVERAGFGRVMGCER